MSKNGDEYRNLELQGVLQIGDIYLEIMIFKIMRINKKTVIAVFNYT